MHRPWGDYNVKCVADLRGAASNLVTDGFLVEEYIHHQYALRVVSKLALQFGADEFREAYNGHNVGGPRGEEGFPYIRCCCRFSRMPCLA